MTKLFILVFISFPLLGMYGGPTRDKEEAKMIREEVKRTNKEVWENYKKKEEERRERVEKAEEARVEERKNREKVSVKSLVGRLKKK